MANYGDKYRIDFNNIDGKSFRVVISQKEYVETSHHFGRAGASGRTVDA